MGLAFTTIQPQVQSVQQPTQQPMQPGVVFNNSGYNYRLPTLAEQRQAENDRQAKAVADYNASIPKNVGYRQVMKENPDYNPSPWGMFGFNEFGFGAGINERYIPVTDQAGNPTYEQYNQDTGEVIKPFVAPAALPRPVNTVTKPVENLGTNAGNQIIKPYYNTTSPTQSSYYWGAQTSGNGTTPTPVGQAPAQAWGTGNRGIIPEFNVDNFIQQMLSPEWQAATQQTTPAEYGAKS